MVSILKKEKSKPQRKKSVVIKQGNHTTIDAPNRGNVEPNEIWDTRDEIQRRRHQLKSLLGSPALISSLPKTPENENTRQLYSDYYEKFQVTKLFKKVINQDKAYRRHYHSYLHKSTQSDDAPSYQEQFLRKNLFHISARSKQGALERAERNRQQVSELTR